MSYIYHATPQADREMLPFLPAALQSLAKRFNWKLSEDSGSISLAMADRPSWRTVTIDKTTGRVAYDTDYAELKTEVFDKLMSGERFADHLLVALNAEKLKLEGYDYEWADGADVYLTKKQAEWLKVEGVL